MEMRDNVFCHEFPYLGSKVSPTIAREHAAVAEHLLGCDTKGIHAALATTDTGFRPEQLR